MKPYAIGTLSPPPIEFGDIVILLRSVQFRADSFADVLSGHGIPVHSDGGAGFFNAAEIRDILCLLQVLDNQQQDIPLAAVLRSPLAGIPDADDALARIRLKYRGDDSKAGQGDALVGRGDANAGGDDAIIGDVDAMVGQGEAAAGTVDAGARP